jgi:hypothetical protein
MKRLLPITLILALILVSGCMMTKPNKIRYNQYPTAKGAVTLGMTGKEVRDILGPPTAIVTSETAIQAKALFGSNPMDYDSIKEKDWIWHDSDPNAFAFEVPRALSITMEDGVVTGIKTWGDWKNNTLGIR